MDKNFLPEWPCKKCLTEQGKYDIDNVAFKINFFLNALLNYKPIRSILDHKLYEKGFSAGYDRRKQECPTSSK